LVAAKALPAYLPYFALGMLVALWVEGGGARLGRAATVAVVFGGAVCVGANALWDSSGGASALALGGAPLQGLLPGIGFAGLVAAVVAGRGVAASWTRFRPLAALGLVSYGVYLWHLPLMLFGARLDLLPQAFVPRLLVVLLPALAAGTASWLL